MRAAVLQIARGPMFAGIACVHTRSQLVLLLQLPSERLPVRPLRLQRQWPPPEFLTRRWARVMLLVKWRVPVPSMH
eukprot:522997-Amphidinium_carterae.1